MRRALLRLASQRRRGPPVISSRCHSAAAQGRAHWTEGALTVEEIETTVVAAEKTFAAHPSPSSLLQLAGSLADAGRAYLCGTVINGMVPLQPFRARALLSRALALQKEQLPANDVEVARTSVALALALRYLRPVDTAADCGGILPNDGELNAIADGVPLLSEGDVHAILAVAERRSPGRAAPGMAEAFVQAEVPLGQRAPARALLEAAVPALEAAMRRGQASGSVPAPASLQLELVRARALLGWVLADFHDHARAQPVLRAGLSLLDAVEAQDDWEPPPPATALPASAPPAALPPLRGVLLHALGHSLLRFPSPLSRENAVAAADALERAAHAKRAFYGSLRGNDHPDVFVSLAHLCHACVLQRRDVAAQSRARALLSQLRAAPFDSRVPGLIQSLKLAEYLGKELGGA